MSKLFKVLCEEFGISGMNAPPGLNSVETVNTKIDRAEKTEEVDKAKRPGRGVFV